ncbi:MAG: efflux RND transporter permease subunit [Gemmatimonadales bacterium]|nr:efflux RND transporter permease subunit [Gemmatimonadales bacterium]
MIEHILEWSLRNRFLVLALALLLVVGGVAALRTLPIDAVPDVTNVQVQVLTSAPALGPEEVERFITTPVELAMSGLPRLQEVRSTSRFGLSAVTVVFEDGTDIYFARQLVNERVQEARRDIPPGYGEPEMGPVTTGLGEIYQFEVRGSGKSLMELRTILEWEIAPRLRAVPGVVEVNAFGGELKTYEVQLRPERLIQYGISLTEVFEALERNNANAGGAYIEKSSEQYLIRGEGLVGSLEDVGNIVVASDPQDGTPTYIRQLGEVRFAAMVRQGAVTRDGRGEAVTGITLMLLGANSREVVNRVKETVEGLRPGLERLGVSIDPFYDRTVLIRKTIATVAKSLAEGGLLVVVVLFLMLRNLRAGLIAASAIPLSLLAAFIGMRAFGISGNLMSLGSIDFGFIVEGAVIVIENAVRLIAARSHHLGRALTAEERSGEVLQASREVLRSTAFGVTIISIVYLPILSLTGIEGKMFRPMALTVLFALAGSLVLSLTLIPVLASLFLPKKIAEEESGIVRQSRRLLEPLVRNALAKPLRWVAGASALFIVSLGVAPFLGAEFIPRLDEGALALQAWRLPSVSLEESIRQTTKLETVLKQFPEVVTVVSKTGRAEIATDPMGVEISDVLVMLKPHGEWTTASDREGLIAAFDSALTGSIAGTIFSYSQPIELRVSELISGVRSDVALKIFGDDLATLERVGEQAVRVLEQVPGAADVKAEQTAGLPLLRVVLNRASIARYGINAADVLDVIQALGGREVGVVLEGQRRFVLQVRFAPEARRDLTQLAGLTVRSPSGTPIPLAQLADIRVEDGHSQISHEAGKRRITVELNVRGRDLAGFVREAQGTLESAGIVPAGYFTEWGGQFKNLAQATRRLLIVVPAALGLIFVLLYMSQGSAQLAGIIYLNVPFALSGGLLALAVRGMPLSISAGVGFIALFGVAVLNGLVLMSFVKQRREEGAGPDEAAFDAASVRLRPILTAGLVAALGFLPMAVASGSGAEVQKPLATVVIGGLVPSTILTLLVLPAVYVWLERRRSRREKERVA